MSRWLLLVGLLAGCKDGLGGACKDDGDCQAGLFCGHTGQLKNVCTASCAEQPSYCEMRWGAQAFCSSAQYCMKGTQTDPCDGRCPPTTTKCDTTVTPPTCLPK